MSCRQDGKPYCKEDFEDLFATKCAVCKKVITSTFVGAMGKSFHDGCFRCCSCDKAIKGPFLKSPDQFPACSKDCLAEYYKKVVLPKRNAEENSEGRK